MGSGHNQQNFVSAILGLSIAGIWENARPEWELHAVYNDPTERVCECGHQPIHQICVIKNRYNRNEAEVGNVCVHKFMQLAPARVSAVLRRVTAEITKSLNPYSLDLFQRRGVLSHGEVSDYEGYWRKRTRMTDAQRRQKLEINKRVLEFAKREEIRLRAKFLAMGLKPRAA
jgi:hypothetical protein